MAMGMTVDATLAKTVLSDTWEWNGTCWLPITPPSGPGPRHGHTMTYNPDSQRTLLFGSNLGDQDEVWEWSETQ